MTDIVAKSTNGAWFGLFCHSIRELAEMFWSKQYRVAWESQNQILAENIIQAVWNNEGSRVLVAVQCQRLHRLIPHFSQVAQAQGYPPLRFVEENETGFERFIT